VPKAPRFINYLAALIAGALALIRSPRLQALQADGPAWEAPRWAAGAA
jgi:hypothetical protein